MRLALVLLVACSGYGQTPRPEVRIGRVEQTYCFARQDPLSGVVTSRVRLRFDIRLRYVNLRSRDLIVPNLTRDHVAVMDVSGNVLAERRDSDYQYDLKAAGVALAQPPADYFSMVPSLSEREAFVGSYVIWEPFDQTWYGKELRIRIDRTPAYPEALRTELRGKWGSFGDLWDGGVSPLEVTVKLEAPTKIEPCPFPQI